MKIIRRISFTFVILAIWLVANAQPFGDAVSGYRIIKQEYHNSSSEKACTFFQYNRNNQLHQAKWTLLDESRSSINYYEYDERGNLVATSRKFSDGLYSFEQFEYDSAGHKLSECFYRSDSISGNASYIYENGLLKEAHFNRHKGWLKGILYFHYDNTMKKQKAILWDAKKPIAEVRYEYDSIGNLTDETWDFNGKWMQAFHYIYEKTGTQQLFYSSPYLSGLKNYRIKSESYTFNNEIGGPSTYLYNEKGLLGTKKFSRTDGLKTNTQYTYDPENRLISSERTYPDGRKARFTYSYDENNNLISRYCYSNDSITAFESYFYNADGDLFMAYLKNFDNWLTGKILFRKNVSGKLKEGLFKGQDGFDATIYFSYDVNNLLKEIRWDFSFGKFQKYEFEYESIH